MKNFEANNHSVSDVLVTFLNKSLDIVDRSKIDNRSKHLERNDSMFVNENDLKQLSLLENDDRSIKQMKKSNILNSLFFLSSNSWIDDVEEKKLNVQKKIDRKTRKVEKK